MKIIDELTFYLSNLEHGQKIDAINKIKIALHDLGPFKNEPVGCVLWLKNGDVSANNYNPNVVAPPKMKLLEHSISEDGYTQPIVTYPRRAILKLLTVSTGQELGKSLERSEKEL